MLRLVQATSSFGRLVFRFRRNSAPITHKFATCFSTIPNKTIEDDTVPVEVLRKITSSKVQSLLTAFDAAILAKGTEHAEEYFFSMLRHNFKPNEDRLTELARLYAADCNELRAENLFNVAVQNDLELRPGFFSQILLSFRKGHNIDAIQRILDTASTNCNFSPQDIAHARGLTLVDQQHVCEVIKKLIPRFEVVVPTDRTANATLGNEVSNVTEQWQVEAEIGRTVFGIPTKTFLQNMEDQDIDPASWDVSISQKEFPFRCWLNPLATAIAEERQKYLNSQQQSVLDADGNELKAPKYQEYLFSLPLSNREIARTILVTMERFLYGNEFGVRTALACKEISRALFRHTFRVEHGRRGITKQINLVYTQYLAEIQKPEILANNTQKDIWLGICKEHNFAPEGELLVPWPVNIATSIGAHLLDALIKSSQVSHLSNDEEDSYPAFHCTFDFERTKRIGVIKVQSKVNEILKGDKNAELNPKALLSRALDATFLPMLTPPKPWTSVLSGAYLISPSAFVRSEDDVYRHYSLLNDMEHKLDRVFDALNYISLTEWELNEPVFDAICKLFATEEDNYDDLAIPPAKVDPPSPELIANKDAKEMKEIMEEFKKIDQDFNSQRIDLSLRLLVANYVKGKHFWLPHNLDFRGRAYVTPPYMSHIGNDMSRGLLKFGVKKPLGERGLRWLKIHLSNVYGNDKCSLDERAQFADQNWEDIVDSAQNPLGPPRVEGQGKWWRESENPWQTLAACFELYAAMTSPNPEEFLSGLPVHQDGTCNGLQHYAALGRDVEGARHVNLAPVDEDRPQDVYSAVARRIDTIMSHHARGDFNTYPNPLPKSSSDTVQQMATTLTALGPMKRKVVKQTVMTNVYGVTVIGGRAQVLKQVKAFNLVPDEERVQTAAYITALVFQSLGTMFEAAQAIQKWLSRQAHQIACTGDPVSWVTPLGLPVVQPYSRQVRSNITTKLHTIVLSSANDLSQPPNPRKQSSAFPPNFVHSLDSSHMMMTAIACRKDNVTFVSVHDSYWTHAATVDTMSKHCREQFVELHSKPILEQLHAFFQSHYNGRDKVAGSVRGVVEIEDLPQKGDFDINLVKDSRYFFS